MPKSGWIIAAWLGLLFAAAGCGTHVVSVPCNTSSCPGCCDEKGDCQAGTSALICGSNGAMCTACKAGQQCGTTGTCGGAGGGGRVGGGYGHGGGGGGGGVGGGSCTGGGA